VCSIRALPWNCGNSERDAKTKDQAKKSKVGSIPLTMTGRISRKELRQRKYAAYESTHEESAISEGLEFPLGIWRLNLGFGAQAIK
jgi:hypothetical protein